jgi:YD repeat-containing protein
LLLNEITGNGENSILVTSYQYDENGNCTSKTDIDASTSILQYDEFDRIKNNFLQNGSFVNYQYNAAGEATLETLYDINNIPLQQTAYGYDNCGRCTSIRKRQTCFTNNDSNDFVTIYKFDCLDNLIKKTIKAENETNDINIEFGFDSKNRLTKIIDGMSNSQSFIYDKDDNVKSVINEINLVSANTYDAFGRKILSQTQNNNRRAFNYDSLNRCIKETLYDVNSIPIEQKRYEYDNIGHLSKQIIMREPASTQIANIATDNVIFYNYNGSGLLRSQTTIYDNNEQSIEQFDYDIIGRISKITDPVGNSTEILYDVNIPGRISGQLLTITDGNSQRTIPTRLKYDTSGRISESKIDSNLVTQFFYDSADRVSKQIKPGGLENSYKYDTFNNVTEIKQGSRNAQFSYDRTGRLISITAYEPNAQKTIFEYDKNAKITKIIFADGTQEKFKYDAAGKLIKKTLRGNDNIYSGYDAEDNLIWQSDDPNGPDGNIDSAEFLVEFEYNANGLITYAGKSING